MNDSELNHIDTEPNFRILRRVALLSNFLAKQLTGPRRSLAYRIKAEACSSLILYGRATVNGIWPGGILALDILGGPKMRLHVRRSHLRPEALAALGYEDQSAPVVSSLAEQTGAHNLPMRARRATGAGQ